MRSQEKGPQDAVASRQRPPLRRSGRNPPESHSSSEPDGLLSSDDDSFGLSKVFATKPKEEAPVITSPHRKASLPSAPSRSLLEESDDSDDRKPHTLPVQEPPRPTPPLPLPPKATIPNAATLSARHPESFPSDDSDDEFDTPLRRSPATRRPVFQELSTPLWSSTTTSSNVVDKNTALPTTSPSTLIEDSNVLGDHNQMAFANDPLRSSPLFVSTQDVDALNGRITLPLLCWTMLCNMACQRTFPAMFSSVPPILCNSLS
jgi:hypothetical protein